MSLGQDPNDPFSQGQVPAWRQQMQLPLLQGQQSGFGPVGSLDFAGIQPPQAPPPGISELLASIPTAKKPKANRAQSAILNRFVETGGGAPLHGDTTSNMLSGQQRRRMMNQRSTGTHR